jgi:hypothetical protein
MSKRVVRNAREASEALGRLTWLRNVLTIPAITMVLMLSRTLNVCAAALFAYAAFLVANPTVVATRYGRIARGARDPFALPTAAPAARARGLTPDNRPQRPAG